MWKKIFVAVILSTCFLSCANVEAEQSAADEYRRIFASGNFYLEFKDGRWGSRIIASKDGTRMERMNYKFENGSLTWLNPLGAIFGGTGDKNPEVMFKDGKYYNFVAKNKAHVCAAKDLHNENLDPREGWNKISEKLAVPNELAVFFWDDPYRKKSPAISKPEFMGSGKAFFEDKEYESDNYISRIKSHYGDKEVFLLYQLFYKDGKLFRVDLCLMEELVLYPISSLEIVKIQREIPKGTFQIYKGTKLYAAGTGDMDDLLERPKEIGMLEGTL